MARRVAHLSSLSGKGWRPVIGLEIHSRLSSPLKLFSPAPTSTSLRPNTNVAPFDAGIPGTLPIINHHCIELATKTAIALNCTISSPFTFDRKHYFYPDLPNGYQITQFFHPFARNGVFDLHERGLSVGIEQIQIEQDSAKSIIDARTNSTLVDLNRAGTGILEIVTKPCIHSSEDAVYFLKKLQRLLWYIQVSPAGMDDGSFRCDVNISVHREGSPLGNRVELKHIHKFSSIGASIDYEISRQISLLEQGKLVKQETRGFNSNTQSTFPLREKEESNEYYFLQDPDISPIHITDSYIEEIRSSMPEPLDIKRDRFIKEFQLSNEQIEILFSEPNGAEFFESAAKYSKTPNSSVLIAKWIIGDLFGILHKDALDMSTCPVSPLQFAELIDLIVNCQVSARQGKQVLALMMKGDLSGPFEIVKRNGWIQQQDGLQEIVDQVFAENENIVQDIRNGKTKLIRYLVGQVMKATKGNADPKIAASLVNKKLE